MSDGPNYFVDGYSVTYASYSDFISLSYPERTKEPLFFIPGEAVLSRDPLDFDPYDHCAKCGHSLVAHRPIEPYFCPGTQWMWDYASTWEGWL